MLGSSAFHNFAFANMPHDKAEHEKHVNKIRVATQNEFHSGLCMHEKHIGSV
jgi:hypothetical protein